MKRFSISLILILILVFAFTGKAEVTQNTPEKVVKVRQAFMEKLPGTFDAAEYLRVQREKFDWLISEAPALTSGSVITVDVTAADLEALENDTCETCGDRNSSTYKLRVGLVKGVGAGVNFAGLNQRALRKGHWGPGSVQSARDGGFTWTAAVESPTASALRIHFTNFLLPQNAALYIYNTDGEVFGPYTGAGPGNAGDFWSNTVSGSLAYIQLRHFGEPEGEAARFDIGDVVYLGSRFLLPLMQQQKVVEDIARTKTLCSYNEPCIEDASCYNDSAVNDAKKAAAHMQFVSGPWVYICSGGLIADKDTSSQIPYFMTANHCISTRKMANSLECFWQYATSSCGGACYDPIGAVPRTLGADIVSHSGTGDYSLMQLWEDPPAGSVFLGWNSGDVANVNNTELFRISHPSGAPQAYSTHRVDTGAGTCGGWPRGSWIYSRDVIGAVEQGSSGSPVVNAGGQLVGQLTGWCGSNLDDVCDSVNNATVDGAFASYYDDVAQYLDNGGGTPGGTMHIASIVLSTKKKGPRTDAIATVTIVDENDNPVSGADVTGTFTGDATGTKTAVTNTSGVATLKVTVNGTVTNFGFCVDNVTHASYTYDSDANVVTCANY